MPTGMCGMRVRVQCMQGSRSIMTYPSEKYSVRAMLPK